MKKKSKKLTKQQICAYRGCKIRSFGIKKCTVYSIAFKLLDSIYVYQYQCINCGRIFYFADEQDINEPYYSDMTDISGKIS